MLSDPRFAAIVAELRQIPLSALGCRLLHWNPALGQPDEGGGQFYLPLDSRSGGGKAKLFFAKVYKAQYAAATDLGTAERQFGLTYSKWDYSKASIDPHLKTFLRCAEQAGALVASAGDRVGSLVTAATVAVKNDFHRWIFAVYDMAWGNAPDGPLRPRYQRLAWHAPPAPRNPPDAPLRAMRYIPLDGFNAYLERDESILYDREHIRSVPWSEVRARLAPNYAVAPDHLEVPYRSWQEKLPEYYASDLDDIVRASVQAVDLLSARLEPYRPEKAAEPTATADGGSV